MVFTLIFPVLHETVSKAPLLADFNHEQEEFIKSKGGKEQVLMALSSLVIRKLNMYNVRNQHHGLVTRERRSSGKRFLLSQRIGGTSSEPLLRCSSKRTLVPLQLVDEEMCQGVDFDFEYSAVAAHAVVLLGEDSRLRDMR